MRLYLSNYWKKNIITSLVIIFIIVIATTAFCIWSCDKEDYILVMCSLFFIILYCCMIFKTMKLIRYVEEENQRLVMYSFDGKKMSSINLEEDIYYEILPLTEGSFSQPDYIILSNIPFTSYRASGFTKLVPTCKTLDANGSQIIISSKYQDILKNIRSNTRGRFFCIDKN